MSGGQMINHFIISYSACSFSVHYLSNGATCISGSAYKCASESPLQETTRSDSTYLGFCSKLVSAFSLFTMSKFTADSCRGKRSSVIKRALKNFRKIALIDFYLIVSKNSPIPGCCHIQLNSCTYVLRSVYMHGTYMH